MITGLRILRLSFLAILMMTGMSPVSASASEPLFPESFSSDTFIQSDHDLAGNLIANEFEDSGITLPHMFVSHALATAWGDYDSDDDLDIVFSYEDSDRSYTRIFRNEGGGVFTEVDVGFVGVDYSYFEWGDYNNDGYLDLLLMGRSHWYPDVYVAKIYRNNGDGSFTDINAGLVGGYFGYGAWGDYDNDGDLDILLTSYNGGTLLYRNDGGDSFTLVNEGFIDVGSSPVAWGDYNQDGYPDILLTGFNVDTNIHETKIYRNNADGTFTDINADLIGVDGGSAAWGDYDNDGDLDFLITGCLAIYCYTFNSLIYRNDGNDTFVDINAGLPGAGDYYGSSWGDFDNDGDLDILLSGIIDSLPATRVYRNDGGDTFTDIEFDFLTKQRGPTAWGDFDNDNDLDLLLGYKIYRNLTNTANTPPAAPTNLSAWGTSNTAYLSWEPSSDDHTQSNTMTYNLRIGTLSGGQDVASPMADISTGYRYIPAMGGQYQGTQAVFRWVIPGQIYYWSVQAIDSAFVGSPFAAEGMFRLPTPTLQYTSPTYSIPETDGTAVITVTLSESYVTTTTIDYQTGDGTAEAGSDYLPLNGTLSFSPGETTNVLNIPIVDDDLPETDETLFVTLSNPINAMLGSPDVAVLTILDNDRFLHMDLEVTKSANPPGIVAPGDNFSYILNFANNGPDTAAGVQITDTLPTLMTDPVVFSSGALITPTLGYSYSWQVENLSPSEGGVITITGILDPDLNTEFVFTNTASIQGYYTDTNPANNSSSVAIEINIPPTADAGGPYTIPEGDMTVLDASYSNDPGNDIDYYEWDLDNDGLFDDASNITTTFTSLDDGIFPIGLKVTDEDGDTGIDHADVTVNNIPPSLSNLLITSPVEKGTIAALSGGIFDPGTLDAFELSVDWGDGQVDVFNYLAGTTDFIEEHIYLNGGIYTVSLTIGDDDGGTDTATLTIYVNPIYTNDFEDPVEAEWCIDDRSTTPSGRQFLGELGNQTNCLILTNLPDQSKVTISFDLYIIRSWDGNYSQQASSSYTEELYDPQVSLGPDIWQFQADGQILLFTTFSNWQLLDFRQAYPGFFPNGDYPAQAGAVEVNTLQYLFGPHQMDAVYHLSFTVDHSGDMLILYFLATGLQGITDESWGLDNVTVNISTDSGGPYIIFIPMVYRP
jgi:uncharacterized repeat protein (TIGR01451 family)